VKRKEHQDVFFNGCLPDEEDNGKAFYFHTDAFLVSLQRNGKSAAAQREECWRETRKR